MSEIPGMLWFPKHASGCLEWVGFLNTPLVLVLSACVSSNESGSSMLTIKWMTSSTPWPACKLCRFLSLIQTATGTLSLQFICNVSCIPVTLLTRLFHWLWPMASNSLTTNWTQSQPAASVKFLGVFGFRKGELSITNHGSRVGTMKFTKTCWFFSWFASLGAFWSVSCCPLWC